MIDGDQSEHLLMHVLSLLQLANAALNAKLAKLGLKFGKIPKEVADKINSKKKPNPIEAKVSCIFLH